MSSTFACVQAIVWLSVEDAITSHVFVFKGRGVIWCHFFYFHFYLLAVPDLLLVHVTPGKVFLLSFHLHNKYLISLI